MKEPDERARNAETVALMALSWVLQDQARADRLLALTGLTPDLLRASLGEHAVQLAVLDYLAGNESELLAAAQALACDPAEITAARQGLGARSAV